MITALVFSTRIVRGGDNGCEPGFGMVTETEIGNGQCYDKFSSSNSKSPSAVSTELCSATSGWTQSPRERGSGGIKRGGGTPLIELSEAIKPNANAKGVPDVKDNVYDNSAVGGMLNGEEFEGPRIIKIEKTLDSKRDF